MRSTSSARRAGHCEAWTTRSAPVAERPKKGEQVGEAAVARDLRDVGGEVGARGGGVRDRGGGGRLGARDSRGSEDAGGQGRADGGSSHPAEDGTPGWTVGRRSFRTWHGNPPSRGTAGHRARGRSVAGMGLRCGARTHNVSKFFRYIAQVR